MNTSLGFIFLLALSLASLSGCNDSAPKVSEKTVALYGKHCARCHEVGAANAPKKGDTKAWKKRLRKGELTLLNSMNKGLVAMPPKGGCSECGDDEFRELIKYMSH